MELRTLLYGNQFHSSLRKLLWRHLAGANSTKKKKRKKMKWNWKLEHRLKVNVEWQKFETDIVFWENWRAMWSVESATAVLSLKDHQQYCIQTCVCIRRSYWCTQLDEHLKWTSINRKKKKSFEINMQQPQYQQQQPVVICVTEMFILVKDHSYPILNAITTTTTTTTTIIIMKKQ